MEEKITLTPIVTIKMNEDHETGEHEMGLEINPGIGRIMNDDAEHNNAASQRIYASEALAIALAMNARALVDEGVHTDEVMHRIMESISANLQWALGVDVHVRPMSGFPTSGNPTPDDGSTLLS